MKTEVIAKAVLVNNADQLLAVRRSPNVRSRAGEWDLPGGFIEDDEEIVDGMLREIREEVGFKVKQQVLQLVYSQTAVREPKGNIVWLFYIGRVSQPTVVLSYEHDKYQWMSLDDAIEVYEYDLHRRLLRYIQKNELLPAKR